MVNRQVDFSRAMRTRQTGFTLVELAISLFVFGMMLLLFGAIFPVVSKSGQAGSNYGQAALLGQHKIDQIREGGYNNLTAALLVSEKIIDSNADGTPKTAAVPAGLPGGTSAYSFTTVDNLVNNGANKGYFPAGSTGVLSFGPALSNQGSPPTVAQALQVTITVSWPNGNSQGGAPITSVFTTHTIIAKI